MMNTSRFIKPLLTLIATLLLLNLAVMLFSEPRNSYAQTFVRAKYMYKVVHVTYDEQSIQAVCDLFSRDGWELVTHYNDILIFKR